MVLWATTIPGPPAKTRQRFRWGGAAQRATPGRRQSGGGREARGRGKQSGLGVCGTRPRGYLRLAALAVSVGAAGIMTVPAAALTAGPAAAARHSPARPRPWIAITSVSPGYAQPTGKVRVSGFVTNPGGSPLRGASFEILSTLAPLTSQQMARYLGAPQSTGTEQPILGTQHNLPTAVPARGTEPWTITLTAHQLGMTTFGVYPVTVQLSVTDPALGTVRPTDYASTFLPFWPGKPAAKKKVSIAWVWPLIDIPQQTVCGTLTSGELAGSVASGGRLNSLLAPGLTPLGRQAQLTWAIDPALLSDLEMMSGQHRVTGTGSCSAGKLAPADAAAKTWLADVQRVAARQDFFTTPYADVDVAALALAHGGLDSELAAAFADGSRAASQAEVPGTPKKILGQPQRVSPAAVGPIAWPAGGIASYGVLEALAAKNKIGTVILSSSLIHTPASVTELYDGQGGKLNVLLANSTLTKILSTRRDGIPGLLPNDYATPRSARAGAREAAAFAKEQWFRAETAMIAATAPAAGRAVIVAPPRRWNPLPGMPGALLADTVTSPWLQPATLASLAGAHSATGRVSPKLPGEKRVTHGELSGSLLAQVRKLSQQIQLLDGILTRSGHGYLSTAVDTAESSAWRGGSAKQRYAERLVRRDSAYVVGRAAPGQDPRFRPRHPGRPERRHAGVGEQRPRPAGHRQAGGQRAGRGPCDHWQVQQRVHRCHHRAGPHAAADQGLGNGGPGGLDRAHAAAGDHRQHVAAGEARQPGGGRHALRDPRHRDHQRRACGVRADRRRPGDPPRRAAGRRLRRRGGRTGPNAQPARSGICGWRNR